MTDLQRINLCLEIAERLKGHITDKEAVDCVNQATDLSRQWMEDKSDVSVELYDLIDGEDKGFTIFQEAEEDERMIDIWNCIIDAFAYICRKVFEDQGAVYFPEPIELVDEETFNHMQDIYHRLEGRYPDKTNIRE